MGRVALFWPQNGNRQTMAEHHVVLKIPPNRQNRSKLSVDLALRAPPQSNRPSRRGFKAQPCPTLFLPSPLATPAVALLQRATSLGTKRASWPARARKRPIGWPASAFAPRIPPTTSCVDWPTARASASPPSNL